MTDNEKSLNYIRKKGERDINKLDYFLKNERLALFIITRKLVGKGTYIGFLQDLYPNKFHVIGTGEIVRRYKKALESNNEEETSLIYSAFNGNTNVIELIKNANVKTLLPTEVITKLVELEIQKADSGKSLVFDGFPRSREQLPFTSTLVERLNNLGFKIIYLQIELAEEILNERRGSRRVCPKCGRVGNIQTLYTGSIDFDPLSKEFILRCDNAMCNREKMINKIGDLEELKMMAERENEMDEMAKTIEEKEKERFIRLRSDVPVDEFNGIEEELNHYTELSLSNGTIIKNQKRQIATSEGKKVYSVDPKGIVPTIIREIVNRLG